MIKCCSVIYNPGHGGNFIARVLSLSKETVPYLPRDIHSFQDEELKDLQEMSSHQRYQHIQYRGLVTHKEWHSNSLNPPDIFYQNPKVNDYFDWAILCNHYDELSPPRIDFVRKGLLVDLDIDRYGHWVQKSKEKLSKIFFPSNSEGGFSAEQERSRFEQRFPTMIFSMTDVLSGPAEFLKEYRSACEFLDITPETDLALDLYQDWHRFRYLAMIE